MEAPPPVEPELNLLTQWGSPGDEDRRKKAAVLSVVGHAVLILLLITVPISVSEPERKQAPQRVTPLIEPPTELTQRAPNNGKSPRNSMQSKSWNGHECRSPRERLRPRGHARFVRAMCRSRLR